MKKLTYVISASSIVIFLLCALFHFLYKWSGYNEFVGIIAPTNESIFQHVKMIFMPIIIYYVVTYFIFRNKTNINIDKWIAYPLITFIITSVIIIALYYTLNYGFSISSMFLDILSLFIGLVASAIICIRLELSNINYQIKYYVPIVCLVVIFGLLVYFNYFPLEINFFYDKENMTNNAVKK